MAGLALATGFGTPGFAQAPLSAIDWLSDSVILPAPVAKPRAPREKDIVTSALPESITVRPLDAPTPDTVGLVSARRLGLPGDIWGASSSAQLARLLATHRPSDIPALRDLYKALLVAELDPPLDSNGDKTLFLARIDALLAMGALTDAAELLDRAGRTEPMYFVRWFDISLLIGTENRACERMRALPQISPTYGARIFCLARGGDWQAAAVTLETAEILGLLDPQEDALLARFLLAELSEDAEPLPPQRAPSPLVFSMYAAVGEPLATPNLPLAFAHADLRPVTGWKARIAAAERLARAGAIDGHRLIEIYSERLPAASGGVWDRIDAVQEFAVGLNRSDPTAVSAALPAAWAAMVAAGLEVPFAEAVAEPLEHLPLSGGAQDIQLKVGLLSPDYRSAAARTKGRMPQHAFWLALAQDETARATPTDPLAGALRDGFGTETLSDPMQTLIDQNRRGEAILRAIDMFATGASGNFDELQQAVATLRAVGLNDAAQRAALQLLILDPAQ